MPNKDQFEGRGAEAGGKVKETAGDLTGDAKLQAEGKADQAKGKVQKTFGDVKNDLRN
ncbi:MAG TPA: CsbD family protein [Caulobacteraceae bacterium]|nr:CsbD family protein [Caulobacteraceae bacterium]